MRWSLKAAPLAGLVLLASCATGDRHAASNQAYETALSGWAGQSPFILRDKWGKAQDSVTQPDGRVALIYQDQYIEELSDYMVPSGESYEVPASGGGMALAVNSDPKIFPRQGRKLQRTCITQFSLDSQGQIASVEAIGACQKDDLDDGRLPRG